MILRTLLVLSVLCPLLQAEDKKPTLEEKIANSKPLELEAKVIKKGEATLRVTPLLMDKPYLSDWFADGPRSVRIEGDRLQALIQSRGNKESIHGFVLPKVGGKLTYDEGFGDKGTAPYDSKTSEWKPRENLSDWSLDLVSRPLGDLLGHPDVSQEKEKGQLLIVKDAEGKQLAELGFVDKNNKICWLHNFCGWKDLVFLVDGNCRKIGVWTIGGKHLFDIECDELGLDYPWLQAIDITEDGAMLLGFTQKRKDAEGKSNSEIQEVAFLKVTGLDTIKAAK